MKIKAAIICLLSAAFIAATSQLADAGIAGSDHDFSLQGWNTSGETCRPCHVPHKAKKVPLWARNDTSQIFTLYDSNPNYSGNGIYVTDILTTNAAMCLSCHDGTLALSGGTYIDPGKSIGSTGNLGNDHPLGVEYPNDPVNYNDISSDPDVKLDGLYVTCTSCHDPHNKVVNTKLLVKSNFGSALCYTCHIK